MGMKNVSRTARSARVGALSTLLAAVLVGGQSVATAAPLPTPAPTPTSATTLVQPQDFGDICYGALPSQAHDTLDLIERGGPYPYPQDGGVFYNREGLLPDQATGYYHEYTVETPGIDHRGARRVVTGDSAQEDYYTADHYESFDLIDYGC
ncbi:ribonuclease domain-containing protein [Streptomyces sp. DSM 44915]|uniref:Ribonuclease domain-containing protein n=1 Tax=Streptomyces chisholmiae TaxID=3075540 RepID=A0ABU2JMZ4_9ACTN|nr:ribonuclease domain-containing protein [Streptomyces sp. DSM 44915]MDT0266354.1 ribonuclease domain-containing protein [Streptomyces sp. DSM 44915]